MRSTAAIALFAIAITPLAAQRQRQRVDPDSIHLELFTYQHDTFDSAAIDDDVAYTAYLPKGYDDKEQAATKWPLIVWLHGMFEDELRFHTRGGAPMLDAAVKDGTLPPCIFVCPNGGRTSMYVNRKDKKYEDLVTVDLLQHLAKKYRVSDRRDQRAIMGVSMGGMAALRIAFTQPQLFGAVAVHSSAVLPEDPEQLPARMKGMVQQLGLTEVFGNPIEKEPWQKANPLCLALAADPAKLQGLHIYFDAGTNDRYGFANGNEKLHEALDKKGIEHTWRLIQGGGHSWGDEFQGEALPHSFAAVGTMFKAAGARQEGMKGLDGALDGKGGGKIGGKSGGDADGKGDTGGKR